MPAPSPSPGRPRRSVLYLPGSNPRALDKARTLPADGLIFDLEDAVAPEAKEAARTTIAAALSEGGYAPRELILRVNGLDTVWGHADLAVAATLPIDAVLLPKVESADRVRLADSPSRRARRAAGSVGVVHDRNPARGSAGGRDRRREPASQRRWCSGPRI